MFCVVVCKRSIIEDEQVIGITHGLAYLHEKDMIHSDLKGVSPLFFFKSTIPF